MYEGSLRQRSAPALVRRGLARLLSHSSIEATDAGRDYIVANMPCQTCADLILLMNGPSTVADLARREHWSLDDLTQFGREHMVGGHLRDLEGFGIAEEISERTWQLTAFGQNLARHMAARREAA